MSKTVVLVTPPSHTHRTAEENLGIGYLAAVLKQAGYNVSIVDGWLSGLDVIEIVKRVLLISDVLFVAISAYYHSLDDIKEIIKSLRDAGCTTPIIGGGFGPTFHDEEFLRAGCTLVVRGEAESIIVKLADSLPLSDFLYNKISGLSWLDKIGNMEKSGKLIPVVELDNIPFPIRDTIYQTIALNNPPHILTSRGCNSFCLYCSVVSFTRQMDATPKWRQRSISNIVDEIEYLYMTYGQKCFKFVDDSFLEPPRDERWVENFATALTKRNLKITFRTQVRADRLTLGIVSTLAAIGWFATSVGIESGSTTALLRMKKEATIDNNISALNLLQANGVYVQMGMILFDQDTTLIELGENLAFMRSLRWPISKGIFTEMYASEGTPFTKLLHHNQLILDSSKGNFKYRHQNQEIEPIYLALKAWHRSHSSIYDRAINPIGAPKVLPTVGYSDYHAVCLKLYDLDILFFDEIFDLACSGNTAVLTAEYVDRRIAESADIYDGIEHALNELDVRHGLTYDASPNPFIA